MLIVSMIFKSNRRYKKMETKKPMIYLSIATTAIIALFWSVWYLINGPVTVVTSIKMTEDWIINLPFGVSRWWDILTGPICSILYFKAEKIGISMIFLLTSIIVSIVVITGFNLITGLQGGLLGALVGVLTMILIFDLFLGSRGVFFILCAFMGGGLLSSCIVYNLIIVLGATLILLVFRVVKMTIFRFQEEHYN